MVTESQLEPKKKFTRWLVPGIVIGVVIVLSGAYTAYAFLSPTIRDNVFVDDIGIGGLTIQQAEEKITAELAKRDEPGIKLMVENKAYTIPGTDIDLAYNISGAVKRAWSIGRTTNFSANLQDLLSLPFTTKPIPLTYTYSAAKIAEEVSTIAELVDKPGKDIRIIVENGTPTLYTDTSIGRVLDQPQAVQAVTEALDNFKPATRNLSLTRSIPSVSMASVPAAQAQVENIIKQPLKLAYKQYSFTLSPAQIGTWIITKPDQENLRVDFKETAISEYVTTLAQELNAESREPKVSVVDGKVTDFIAPIAGRRLDQTQTVESILQAFSQRRDGQADVLEITLPVVTERPPVTDASAADLGIVEMIGSATTPFTGSPKNRIANIKNGTKFLTGILIKPGEEFSTLKALGTVDNTTGYLPELVIKGNRTVPEYGGGLCQVSTTLFRAALNAGLPITQRQNHSYRVSYYEKDGDGNRIGPGLDATIYMPNPDFKFLNDTPATLLIQGYVIGDKITFELYGTKDGRTSTVDGPHTLTQTPAGEPIYVETTDLKPGEKKQLETAHPGGTAIATYTITYADGAKKEQVFKSFYRNWPARYLVGAQPQATPDPNAPVTPSTPDTETPNPPAEPPTTSSVTP